MFYTGYNDTLPKGTIMAKKRYRLHNFLIDLILTVFTGGFWLIWIFVREMRRA